MATKSHKVSDTARWLRQDTRRTQRAHFEELHHDLTTSIEGMASEVECVTVALRALLQHVDRMLDEVAHADDAPDD